MGGLYVRPKMNNRLSLAILSVVALLGCKEKPVVMNDSPETIRPHITLKYGDRTVSFPILEAGIWHNQQGTLCIGIEADWGDVEMDSLDGAYGPPMVNAGWEHEKFTSVESLSNTEVVIPQSYNPELEDHNSVFYLSEHLDVDDLTFRFGDLEDGKLPVSLSAFVEEDPTGSKPDQGIQVTGYAIAEWTK